MIKFVKKGKCLCPTCGSLLDTQARPGRAHYAAMFQLDTSTFCSVKKLGRTVTAAEVINLTNPNLQMELTLDTPLIEHGEVISFNAVGKSSDNKGRHSDHYYGRITKDKRVCPMCLRTHKTTTLLLPEAGLCDSYYVAMIGPTGVGKSTMARAVVHPRFQQQLASMLNPGSSMNLLTPVTSSDQPSDSTPLNIPNVYSFMINRSSAPSCLLYLLDLAGELTTTDDGSVLKDILKRYCGAVLVFYDPRNIHAPELLAYQSKRSSYDREHNFDSQRMEPFAFLRRWVNRRVPVAAILTGLDTIVDEAAKHGNVLTVNGVKTRCNGLLSNCALDPVTSESVNQRMALSKHLICSLGLVDEHQVAAQMGWFALSSGTVVEHPSPAGTISEVRMDRARGVIEPMAWLLNALAIERLR